MKCGHDKKHNKLSYATLRHLTSILDEALKHAGGVKNAAKREEICQAFIFQAAYFFDNQWVQFGKRRYRVGFCFQEFAKDPFAPTKALVTDYAEGDMLHEGAIGATDSHFTKGATGAHTFEKIEDVYDK